MKSRIMLLVLAASLLACPAAAVAGDTIESVEKELIEAWSKLKSMSCKTVMDVNAEMNGMKLTSKGIGTVEYLAKDGKYLYRRDVEIENSFGGQPTKMVVSTISDGAFVYSAMEQDGRKMAYKQNLGTGQAAPGGKEMWEPLHEAHTLKLLPNEKLDKKVVYVIEATAKQQRPMAPVKLTIYIQKDTGIAVKTVGANAENKQVMTITLSDIKINAQIDPSRFVFKAPEGVEVIDQTGK